MIADFLRNRITFAVCLALAAFLQFANVFGLHWVNRADMPLEIVGVFFHELGHGMASLLTGGSFYRMQIGFGQGGVAHVDGGSNAATLFAGYFGPTFWGLLIYLAFTRFLRHRMEYVPWICVLIAAVTLLLWVRHFASAGVVIFIAFVFWAITQMEDDRHVIWAMKFAAIYLMLAGMTQPWLLYNYTELYGSEAFRDWDGRALMLETGTHERVWVRIWTACGAIALFIAFALENGDGQD